MSGFFGGYLTKSQADGIYQPLGDYLTQAVADTLYAPVGSTSKWTSQTNGIQSTTDRIGVGVAPYAHTLNFGQKALDVAGMAMYSTTSANTSAYLSLNTYNNGTNNVRKQDGISQLFGMLSTGDFDWYTSDTGLAGSNITFLGPRVRFRKDGGISLQETAVPSTGVAGRGIFTVSSTDSLPYFTDAANNVFPVVTGAQVSTFPDLSRGDSISLTQNRKYYCTFYVSHKTKINKITYAVTNAGAGNATVQVGLYNWTPSGNFTRIVSASETAGAAGARSLSVTPTILPEGLYIAAIVNTSANAVSVSMARESAGLTFANFYVDAAGGLPATETGARTATNLYAWEGFGLA